MFSALPKYALDIIFLLLFCIVSIAYNYDELLFERPYGDHQWRQTDCASMALNYHQEDVNLLEPQMHYRLNEKGEAVGEFPILYYAVGKLYDVFGYHEFIYRMLWLLISFIGSFALFRFAYALLKLPFESLMIGLMPLLSPVVGFYSISFISDPPALYLVCMGLPLLYNAYQLNSVKYFYVCMALFALAGLLKASALILPFSLLGIAGIYFLIQKDWKKLVHMIVGFGVIILANFLWYSYANEFNSMHNTNYFFIRTAPAWEMTKKTFWDLADIIYRIRVNEYYNSDMFLFPLAMILMGLFVRKANVWWFLFVVSMFLAATLYFFMFFQQFRFHDYYMINPVLIVPMIFILAYMTLEKLNLKNHRGIIQLILVLILAQSSLISKSIINFRYQSPEDNFFLSKGYGDIEPYLEEIGIDKDDRVISLPDESPNISLYLMNRKGWSNLYFEDIQEEDIDYFKQVGAKYLIIGDEKLLNDTVIQKFTGKQIGAYKGIEIFEL